MGEVRIRSFRSGDAPGAVTLRRILRAEEVLTVESLIYWRRAAPKRTHTRWWTALDGRDVVGWANAGLMNWTKQEDLADLWVGVHPERRGKGIGGRLFDLANAHLGQLDPRKIYTSVRQGDRIAPRFASKRGFTKARTSKVWQLDPRKVELSDLPDRIEKSERDGFRLARLEELKERPRDFFETYRAAARGIPFDEPIDINYREWKKEIWDFPILDFDGSIVVMHGNRPVSFVNLVVDKEGRRAYHELTGTHPDFRRRGLARLAKMAAIEWCVGNGIDRIFTDNDSTNSDMLAINEHLGYEPRPAIISLAKTL